MTRSYKILLSIRDERGTDTGKIDGISVIAGDLISPDITFVLQIPLKFRYEHPIFKNIKSVKYFKISRSKFNYESIEVFGGSWCFDEVIISEIEFLKLLVFLKIKQSQIINDCPEDFYAEWSTENIKLTKSLIEDYALK